MLEFDFQFVVDLIIEQKPDHRKNIYPDVRNLSQKVTIFIQIRLRTFSVLSVVLLGN